jgi:hypothetical protein
MYYNQKGCLPLFLGTLARILAVGLAVVCIFDVYFHWVELKQVTSIEVANESITSSIISSIIVLCIFYPMVYVIGGIFPTIRIIPRGIIYKHMVIGGG